MSGDILAFSLTNSGEHTVLKFDPQKHNRHSFRLKGYDYAQPGAYFITLVTYHRDELFGKIDNGEMQLSNLGQIVCAEWSHSNNIRKEIIIYDDEFVIMPNHLHGIVWIVGAERVRRTLQPDGVRLQSIEEGASLAPLQAPPRRKPRSLSSFVAGFKSAVTSRADRELNMSGIWQRNYYDHIIRDDQELKTIWDYIDTNPQKWQEDQLRPPLTPAL